MSYDAIRDKLARQQTVILDGAIGTEILRRNVTWADHQLANRPEVVRGIHEDYIRAGADVISTNSFQLCRRALYNHFRDEAHRRHIGARDLDERADKLLAASVRLAVEARARAGAPRPVAVAAAVTTLEWCFRPDLAPPPEQAAREYAALAGLFAEARVDFLLLESMNNLADARAALAAGRGAGLPVWVSFVLGPEGELLSREPLEPAVAEMEKAGADAVLVNCAPPEDVTRALARMKKVCARPFGGFAHIGRFSPPSWKFEFFPQFTDTQEWPPDRYASEAERWREQGASVVGGCCGTTPAHIAALRARLGSNGRGRSS